MNLLDALKQKGTQNHPQGKMNLLNELNQNNISQQPSGLQRFSEGVENYFNKPFEGLRNGLLQGAGNAIISALNLLPRSPGIPGIMEKSRLPHINLEGHNEGHTGKELGHLLGNIGGSLAVPGGAALKSAYAVGRPAGKLGILSDFLKNYGIGYATGENEEGGGRELSGALTTIGALPFNYSKKTIGKGIVKSAKNVEKKISDEYNSIIKSTKDLGAGRVSIPKIGSKEFKEQVSRSERHALDKFYKNPTIENAHKAQSDIGKAIQRLEGIKRERGNFLAPQKEALEEAYRIQKEIQQGIHSTLKSNPKTAELAERYNDVSKAFKENVIPYRSSSAYQKYTTPGPRKENKISESDFVKALKKEKEFMHQIGKEKHPELLLNSLLNLGGTLGAAFYPTKKLYNTFLQGNE